MRDFVFPPADVIGVPIVGESALFPVRRIFCVGANYAAHAREMGRDPDRDPPFFFLKGPDAIVSNGAAVNYPPATSDYQHEVELVVAIGGEAFDVAPEAVADIVFGYAVGLDMTRRDLQMAARGKGRPWDLGKNFAHSAPISAIRRGANGGLPNSGAIALHVNGHIRQEADLSHLIWPVGELVSHLSKAYRLLPGDLIMTGTPAGVGAVVPGDRLEASIKGLPSLTITIADAA